MKAVVNLDLKAETAERAQKIIEDLCMELGRKKLLAGYQYEIETPGGTVTENCVLADGKVIA